MSEDLGGRFVLLHGARKNLGDYLIFERARLLIEHLRPAAEVVTIPRWDPLEDHLAALDGADALIIGGGPGIRPDFHPGVYPLMADITKVPIPMFTLGIGWNAHPGDAVDEHTLTFTTASTKALRAFAAFGVRDYPTRRVLLRAGVEEAQVNGCPAWYSVPDLGSPFTLPDTIERLAVTPAQKPQLQAHSRELIDRMADRFAGSDILVAFHRGIGPGEHTSPTDAANTTFLADHARSRGLRVADLSSGMEGYADYEDRQFHVGYRVHAHLWFMSRRRPSYLFWEDGRGRGATEALGVRGVAAYRRPPFSRLSTRLPWPVGGALRRLTRPWELEQLSVRMMDHLIEEEVAHGWPHFRGAHHLIDHQFGFMRRFIQERLPGPVR